RAPDVDGRDKGDHHDGDDSLRYGRKRNYFCEIFAEDARESSDGAAGDDEKEAPAVKEGGHAAKAVTDVAVETAGFGVGGGELGISERAEQGKDATDGPDEEGQADGAVDLAKDGAGRSKDAGANNRSNEEKQKIAEPECAEKWWHFLAGAVLCASGPKAS